MSLERDGDCDKTSALGPASSLKDAITETGQKRDRQIPLTCFIKPLLGLCHVCTPKPHLCTPVGVPNMGRILDGTVKEIGGDYCTEGKKIQPDTGKLNLSEAGGDHSAQAKTRGPEKVRTYSRPYCQVRTGTRFIRGLAGLSVT